MFRDLKYVSSAVQGLFKHAALFYCLFQWHSTPDKMREHNGVFGEQGWSWMGHLGSNTAVLSLDTRMERSRKQVGGAVCVCLWMCVFVNVWR